MRITQQMMDRNLYEGLNKSLSSLAESQQRMATQKKITRPSDSPCDTQALLAVKDQISVSAQYKTNLSAAQLSLQAADSGAGNITDQLMTAKNLAVQSASVISDSARASLSDQVNGIIKDVMAQLNSKNGNQYVFAGTDSAAAPFTAATTAGPDGADQIRSVAYSGNRAENQVAVSASQKTGTGVSGDEIAAPGAGGIFETLIGLRDAIANGSDTSQLQSDLDNNLDRLNQVQTKLGAQMQSLSGLSDRLASSSLDLESKRSSLEDVDITQEAVTESQRENEYQAVLATTAKRMQLSLINYL